MSPPAAWKAVPDNNIPMSFTETDLREIAAGWHLSFKKSRPEIDICGSPERCRFRTVIEDKSSRLFILENLTPETCRRKEKIIAFLDLLKQNELQSIVSYLKTENGQGIVHHNGNLWQAAPFVGGLPLDRPGYVSDGWRGRALADFLIRLRQVSETASLPGQGDNFSIRHFIESLSRKIALYNPELVHRIDPCTAFLSQHFFHIHDELPTAFCHGDFHPLNVIWSESGINAVIDWEFAGYKPEIYDAANLLGCLGIEDPPALAGELASVFVQTVKAAGLFSDRSWRHLFEFVLALRFAWLSEWLRNRDREMIETELVYMRLLLDNREEIARAWQLPL